MARPEGKTMQVGAVAPPLSKSRAKAKGKAMNLVAYLKGKDTAKGNKAMKSVKRVLAKGKKLSPKRLEVEAKNSMREVLMCLDQMDVEEAAKQAKDRFKETVDAIQAMEKTMMMAVAERDEQQAMVEIVQNQVDVAVAKSSQAQKEFETAVAVSQQAREDASRRRMAVIEATQNMAKLMKEAADCRAKMQIIEDTLEACNNAAALKQAQCELRVAEQIAKAAIEKEKEMIRSIKARKRGALGRLPEIAKLKGTRPPSFGKWSKEKQAVLQKDENQTEKETRMVAKAMEPLASPS